jgi:hypothetical protein
MKEVKPAKVMAGEPIHLGLNCLPAVSQAPWFIAIRRSFCVKVNQPLPMGTRSLLEQ